MELKFSVGFADCRSRLRHRISKAVDSQRFSCGKLYTANRLTGIVEHPPIENRAFCQRSLQFEDDISSGSFVSENSGGVTGSRDAETYRASRQSINANLASGVGFLFLNGFVLAALIRFGDGQPRCANRLPGRHIIHTDSNNRAAL